jgi:hypothetical protein
MILTPSKSQETNSAMHDQPEVEDLKIWQESALESAEEPSTQWYFAQDLLRICDGEKIIEISVDTLVHSVLALFDMMHSFWKFAPSFAERNALASYFRRMDKYHATLHRRVTHALKSFDATKPLATIPGLLNPWINRTLLLYTHNDASREKIKNNIVHLGTFSRIIHLTTFLNRF